MPAAKLRPVLPSTTTVPPVMYSQPWSPDALDDRRGAGVAHAEALARDAAEDTPRPSIAPYITVLPTMMFSSGFAGQSVVGIDDDAPARQPLADVVVGVALELERDAVREERAEALPGGARRT